MNKVIYKIGVLMLLAFAGCSEEFLDIPPQNLVSSDVFLRNDAEVKQAVVGLYDRLQTLHSSCWNGMRFIQNILSDDAQSAGPSADDTPEYDALDKFNWEANNSKILGLWQRLYEIVASSNAIIEKVGADAAATTGMKQMVGEAQAIRAFAYMEIVKMFGDAPLMTSNPASAAEYSKPRTSVAAIYEVIEEDLADAIAILPLKTGYPEADRYRFSKGTAQFLLGKALLYQEKYAESHVVLAQLIATQTDVYDLEANYMDNFLKVSEYGVESIFEAAYVSTLGSTWGSQNGAFDGRTNEVNIQMQLEGPRADNGFFTIYPTYTGTDPWVQGNGTPENPYTYNGTAANYDNGIRGGWGFNLPSKKVGDVLQADPLDTRRFSVLSEAEFVARGGAVQATPKPYMYEGYLRLKYGCRDSETDVTATPEINFGSNIRVMRFADALLMAAEAYHKDGKDAEARTELNKVRRRAGLADTGLSGTALFDLIVLERQKELAFEGSRFYDLVRWGKASAELGTLGFVAGKHELFPIPFDEISSNTEIDEEDQNPGY
jgi:hypothetical protein